MTTINPAIATQTQATAFKGKNVKLAKMFDKLEKKEIIPMEIIDELHSPLQSAIRNGRSKEEIKEIVIREAVGKASVDLLSQQTKEALSKMSAKNAYKPL